MKSYEPVEENVRIHGRTVYDDGSLWLGLSATGVGFNFRGSKVEFILHGDDVPVDSKSGQRFAIFVDGQRYDDVFLNDDKSQTVSLELNKGRHTVRLLKASECSAGTAKLDEIRTDSRWIRPEFKPKHTIEFIGDSLTCGYGVESAKQSDGFQLAQEDATKTFAYKTAEFFDADASLVCYSGCGVLSGYSSDTSKPETYNLMPNFYELTGHCFFSMDKKLIDDVKWDFEELPELIVINLGTNDELYFGKDAKRQEAFKKAYVSFMKRVRKLNPDSHIMSAVGLCGEELFDYVDAAVKSYQKESGDKNVSSLRLDEIDRKVDGAGADGHPKEVTHDKAVLQLTQKIEEEMGW